MTSQRFYRFILNSIFKINISAIVYLALIVVLASVVTAYYNEGDPCYVDDPKYYGYYAPHPVYCYRFLQCTHGIFIGRNCSPGLHWNPEVNLCDWPVNSNCDGLTTQRSTTPTTQAPTTTTEYYTSPTDYETTSEYYSTYYTDAPEV